MQILQRALGLWQASIGVFEAREVRRELAMAAERSKNLKKKSPLGKLKPGTCENMWDCDSPMQCCDFVLFKMCCNGGVGIPAFQPALVPIPIPVERDPYPNQPPPPGSRW